MKKKNYYVEMVTGKIKTGKEWLKDISEHDVLIRDCASKEEVFDIMVYREDYRKVKKVEGSWYYTRKPSFKYL